MNEIWQQYEKGIDYKTSIDLYTIVDRNERFFAGDQWKGIKDTSLPMPVTNAIKYGLSWKVSAVKDEAMKMRFSAENEDPQYRPYGEQITKYSETLWERLKMDYLCEEGLKQAAITGDWVQYFYWDASLNTGQAYKGDIATQLVDNVNYYPGDPNNPNVQEQPYIILAFRMHINKIKEIAKANGVKYTDIGGEEDNDHTAGDRGKIELEDSSKRNVLLKLEKKNGKVYSTMAIRDRVIEPEKDTKLTLYPVAMMNWETRKNSCHGESEVTHIIPNQVYINKETAYAQLSTLNTAIPKLMYDRTRIDKPSNKPSVMIPVNGEVVGAAQYLVPQNMSYDAWRGIKDTIDSTLQMMGANAVTLGNIPNPDNTSAFIATHRAALAPLKLYKQRYKQTIEDIGMIWLDFIQAFYTDGRKIPVQMQGQETIYVPISKTEIEAATLKLRIDVGESSMWSEIEEMQTLDNLLQAGMIQLSDYLERLPDGKIKNKEDLIQKARAKEMQAEAMAQMAGQVPVQ